MKVKVHRFLVYVIDYEDLGETEAKSVVEGDPYMPKQAFYAGSAEIKDWHEGHTINTRKSSIEELGKYFD